MKRSAILFTSILGLFLFGFTRQEFTEFYDVYVQEMIDLLNTTNSSAPPSPSKKPLLDRESSPVALFNKQNFILWLSPVSSEFADQPTYYKQIVTFCKAHNIRKVIWYFGYTTASQAFYDPASTDPNSFVQLLQSNPLPAGTTMELRIECASMDNGVVYAPGTTPPAVPSHALLPDYMATRNFYQSLWWVRDFKNAAGSVISGVTVDPQDNCDNTPDYTPYLSATSADQAVVNYLDEFASLNVDFYALQRGVTFDGTSKVQIFGNRAAIPITDVNLTNDTNTIPNFYNGDANGFAPWTRPNPAAPFLDNVYPQLYNIDSDYLYTLASQPQSAGLKFLQLLSATPYCPGLTSGGAPSTISFLSSANAVTGSGTQFLSELTTDVNSNSPIGFIDSSGVQQCVCPNNDPHYPNTPSSVACTGKVRSVADDTDLTLNTTPATSQTNVPWLYVENEINYREYYLTPEMISGITLMFSAEAPFFGQWTLGQFMDFMNAFYFQGQSYSLYYQDPAISSSPVPVPNQFALFTYEQITGKASPAPANIWFPGE